MGLDEKIKREYFAACKLNISYEEFCRLYSDNVGKIDCLKAFFLAKDIKKPGAAIVSRIGRTVNRKGIKDDAINAFKALAVMLYKIKNADCDDKSIEKILYRMHDARLMEKAKYSQEDLNGLYSSAAQHLSSVNYPSNGVRFHYPLFGGNLLPCGIQFFSKGKRYDYIGIGEPTVFGQDKFKQRVLDFNQRVDAMLYLDALKYLEMLRDCIDVDLQLMKGRVGCGFASELYKLKVRLKEEMKANVRENAMSVFSYLSARLNANDCVPLNEINCCISGPSGKSREASFLHFLDRAVTTWHFQAISTLHLGHQPVFGLGIFVEANGYHFSRQEPTKYLIFEGFPSNHEIYSSIIDIKETALSDFHLSTAKFGTAGPGLPDNSSLSKIVYCLGLLTAKYSNIPKLFINAQHKGVQKSVEYAVREAAKNANIPRDCWEFTNHAEFRMTSDPINGNFKTLEYGGKNFVYTHFLEKPRLPADLMAEVRRDPDWNGEGFFDTWYRWNEFIMETYDAWSPEEKARHPYAESVFKRGKDPQWNLGIGYCKGFEVDVKKECERLGIS